MSAYETILHYWNLWVGLFDGLALPWSDQTTAAIGLVAVLYAVGLFFERVVIKREK